MTETQPKSFSGLAEATMHIEGRATKKPQVTCCIWLRKFEVTKSLVTDQWLGH